MILSRSINKQNTTHTLLPGTPRRLITLHHQRPHSRPTSLIQRCPEHLETKPSPLKVRPNPSRLVNRPSIRHRNQRAKLTQDLRGHQRPRRSTRHIMIKLRTHTTLILNTPEIHITRNHLFSSHIRRNPNTLASKERKRPPK